MNKVIIITVWSILSIITLAHSIKNASEDARWDIMLIWLISELALIEALEKIP